MCIHTHIPAMFNDIHLHTIFNPDIWSLPGVLQPLLLLRNLRITIKKEDRQHFKNILHARSNPNSKMIIGMSGMTCTSYLSLRSINTKQFWK